MHNREIAALFDRMADLLDIEQANPFRVRAYRNAARTVGGHAKPMSELLARGDDLSRLPGIGKDLAAKIAEIVETGRLRALEELEQRVPAALSELMHIDGLGPKRVRSLYHALGVRSPADLSAALEGDRIRSLPGFGARTVEKLRHGIEMLAASEKRTRLVDAEQIAADLLEWMRGSRGLKSIEVAGSFRRRCETVGDLDLLVSAARGSDAMDRFVRYREVDQVLAQGKTRATVRLRSGMQIDLRVVPQASHGAALHYFTGSREHNIAVRTLAVRKKLKLNEYGVFRGDTRIAGRTEADVFAAAGLPFIAPELRENRGEVEAALAGRLPRLIELDDIRGDLHCHSSASDGHPSIAQLAQAALALGYEYLAITDHTRRASVAHGLVRKRLEQQMREIDRLNAKLDGIVILKSAEVDILEDGSLDLPDAVLRELDFTVCAVHYGLGLPRERQTERILRAMDNPLLNVLAHPTGRLIDVRRPYAIDLERIMRAARERGCAIELNAHPDRLDLNDVHCRLAKAIGVRVAIGSDAHACDDLALLRHGIDQARRGWLEAKDVLNTRGLATLRKLLRR
ncbi:MAG: DNA polymerase/3'-5' exonuclease PolX [Burkholderiales bacterium]|nr:MAG: DNA polymerase/3'-5' exonuclease PolX [Burkholderiales bacterium]